MALSLVGDDARKDFTAETLRTQRTWSLDLRGEFRKSKCFAFAGEKGIGSLGEANLFSQSVLADWEKLSLRDLCGFAVRLFLIVIGGK